MKIQQLTVPQALASLHSSPQGLSHEVAARRLQEFGPNQVQAFHRTPLLKRLLQEFTHFFAILLWVAAALTFWSNWKHPGQGMATLGWAIIGVILINGAFSFWQVLGAERALEALENLLPRQVNVLREATYQRIDASQIVPGDLLALEAGDLVPADLRLIEAFHVEVNSATLTGESAPQARDAEPDSSHDIDPVHARNLVLAGTLIAAGEARALVYATGEHTEFGQIARLARSTRSATIPLQREIERLSRLVAILATSLGLVFFALGTWIGLSFWQNFLFAIGIIVANVPEGLLPTVTLGLAMGARRMARRGVLIRNLAAVETLGSTTVIATDKTGTLTENRMRVVRLHVAGVDDPVEPPNLSALAQNQTDLIQGAWLCHGLKPGPLGPDGRVQWLGDPLEIALLDFVRLANPELVDSPVPNRLDEIPFDALRRRFSTIHRLAAGSCLHCKGALEALLPLASHVLTNSVPAPLDSRLSQQLVDAQNRMAADGLKVIALAHRDLADQDIHDDLERNLTIDGLIGLEDPPRPEVPAAMAACRQAGVRVLIVTGDHPQTALAIGRQIGLLDSPEPPVLTGDQLRHMRDSQLQLALDAPEIVFARTTPDQKLRIVRALKRKGHVVAVTGDGVNDAPALREADIGIAMGRSGTDVARQAADMILTDDNFASIVAAIEEGRAVFENIRKFLTYILTSNIPELIPYLAFVLFRIPLPLTIIQILAVDLGTDMLPALGLGAEPPEPGLMNRPPRRRTERLLNFGLMARAYLWLGPIEALSALSAFFFVLQQAGWRYGQSLGPSDPVYRQATTACLTAIVVLQIVNVFLCRSRRSSVFTIRRAPNHLIYAGIALELVLILAIVYHPWGHSIFGTFPLLASAWIFLLPFALLMLTLEELRKLVVRARHRQNAPVTEPPHLPNPVSAPPDSHPALTASTTGHADSQPLAR